MLSVSIKIRNKITHFFILVFLLITSGCAANRQLAAVFFDGVPEYQTTSESNKVSGSNKNEKGSPEERRNVAAINRKKNANATVSIHKPFGERKCEKCHDRNKKSFLVVPKNELCFQCHKKERFFQKFVHGPVAPGTCLSCHYPHKSPNPYLLRYTDEKLCFQCHEPDEIRKIKDHKNRAGCLKCHDPHTQNNKFFLKPEIMKKFKAI
ncbi:cytochrome c3 family protein [Thermotomaculum hydrothermale]|nr:cytochrome c3 family protein [Thermotomaculum hydrothermale]